MIAYRKHFCGIPLLFHGFYGSSFFRALPFPIASTLFAIFLFYERPVELPTGSGRPGVANDAGFATAAYRAPYPFQVCGHCRASLTSQEKISTPHTALVVSALLVSLQPLAYTEVNRRD